jgi:hypothetical protein
MVIRITEANTRNVKLHQQHNPKQTKATSQTAWYYHAANKETVDLHYKWNNSLFEHKQEATFSPATTVLSSSNVVLQMATVKHWKPLCSIRNFGTIKVKTGAAASL